MSHRRRSSLKEFEAYENRLRYKDPTRLKALFEEVEQLKKNVSYLLSIPHNMVTDLHNQAQPCKKNQKRSGSPKKI